MHTHDAIVIGGGQAGPFLAVRLAQAGTKVALVERAHDGGTCVNHGGRPSINDRFSAYALFIDPPLGRVGMGEAQVSATGRPALVGVMPMSVVQQAVHLQPTVSALIPPLLGQLVPLPAQEP